MPRLRVLPPEIRSALPLRKRERVLAAARDAEGAYLVASTQALHLPAGAGADQGGHAWDRLGWERIGHAEWNRDQGRLRVTPIAPFGEAIEHRTVTMPAEPDADQRRIDRLLAVIRERITASVVIDRQVPINGGGVRVVARRQPEPGTEVTWMVELGNGLDASDPDVVRAANEALAQVRAEVAL